jgi:hypothetical protein
LERAQADGPVRSIALGVHQLLLDGTGDPPDSKPVRAPSLAADGTPVAYSLKVQSTGAPPPFRMIVEPGGLAQHVPEQIEAGRALLNRALCLVGWQDASGSLDDALQPLFAVSREACVNGGAASGSDSPSTSRSLIYGFTSTCVMATSLRAGGEPWRLPLISMLEMPNSSRHTAPRSVTRRAFVC